MFGFWLAILLRILIAAWIVSMWIGVILLSRKGRQGDWRLMAAGAACMTVGLPALTVALPQAASDGLVAFFVSFLAACLSLLGLLLFGGGFALHGSRAARARTRLVELEQLTDAMREDLGREQASRSD